MAAANHPYIPPHGSGAALYVRPFYLGIGDNVGGALNPLGGTLVYNRRGTNVPDVIVAEPGLPAQTFQGGDGPLNDPTAMMYVRTGT